MWVSPEGRTADPANPESPSDHAAALSLVFVFNMLVPPPRLALACSQQNHGNQKKACFGSEQQCLRGHLPEQRTPLFLAQEKLSHSQKDP